ncbi:MAG: hypothetical protein ACLQNE_20770 [Thermoguttaceae bacterium]|jgi:hypothetical protein
MKKIPISIVLGSLLVLATGCHPIFDRSPQGAMEAAPMELPQAAAQQQQQQAEMQPCPVHGYNCPGTCQYRLAFGPGRAAPAGQPFNPGPPSAQVTYPYYTLRGPRDFLQRTPTPIGP